jgi:GT2 family glycosyltransferase
MLSIIIPARNNGAFTSHCLGTALAAVATRNLRCEFILLDDASAPEERMLDIFRQHRASAPDHEFKLVRATAHQHYSRIFAIGLSLATRENVLFLSNDMLITPSFLTALLGVSALDRAIGIVRGTSAHTDSHPEHVVVPPMPLRRYPDIDAFSRMMFEMAGLGFVEDKVLSGDAVLIKRALIDRIGVVDYRYFAYFGDVDYGLRAHLAGFKLVCAKGAWLHHEGAGYIKADLARAGGTMAAAQVLRMQVVQRAYETFRGKWDAGLPERYTDLKSLHLFEMARRNADRIDMHQTLPASVAGDLQFH